MNLGLQNAILIESYQWERDVMRSEDVAWASGILEGEGCFSKHKRSNRPNTVLYAIYCEMSDEDVVRRLRDIFQVGTVNIRNKRKDRKPTWIWSVQNKADIKQVLILIEPWMGHRRGAKIDEILGEIS
jgi:hypothetical protein